MCRQHCKGCTRDDIIFDRIGKIAEFLDRGYRTDNYIPDPVRAIDTYCFHTEMLIKYFKRKDLFKLIKNIDVLFHAHVDLLLSHYDTLDWGSWESKVKHSMILFKRDAEEICAAKGITYPDPIAEQIIFYFNTRMGSDEWELTSALKVTWNLLT
ncbi:hypothetical protein SAMN04488542_103250 [Fontibacillus panacisegetis]|uniref:Uncharacterized protein n=1 Tax=Fontibacillus panacisegetis TaxID=670482 RepID=A0A1G7GY07_9BACL|nr:hypothetical protein [Fontibacillus panacisegetis]SDE93052.1 hypothetical protein SAMN04488542_103250 [Fontibacillus panacisegetis]